MDIFEINLGIIFGINFATGNKIQWRILEEASPWVWGKNVLFTTFCQHCMKKNTIGTERGAHTTWNATVGINNADDISVNTHWAYLKSKLSQNAEERDFWINVCW